MATPLYLSERTANSHASGTTITATPGTDVDFTVTEAANAEPSKGWKSSALLSVTSPQRLILDLGGAPSTGLDVVALFGIRGGSDTTINLISDDAITFDSDGGSPQESVSLAWDGSSRELFLNGFGFGSNTRRFWAIEFVFVAADGTPEVGEVFLGVATSLPRQTTRPVPFSLEFTGIVHRSQVGIEHAYPFNTDGLIGFELQFDKHSLTDRAAIIALALAFRQDLSGLLVIAPGDTDTVLLAKPFMVRAMGDWRFAENITWTFQPQRFRVLTQYVGSG